MTTHHSKGPYVGAHMSIAGGLEKAISRGEKVGCEVIQLFLRNQVQWRFPPLSEEMVERFKSEFKASPLKGIVAHASYLLNMATPEKDLREKSIHQLAEEYRRAIRLGLRGLIFHAGSSRGTSRTQGIIRIVKAIKRVLDLVEPQEPDCLLLVENSAGQGDTLPSSLEEWLTVIHEVNSPFLGGCLDTCHIFAAGYPVHEEEGYERVMDFLLSTGMIERIPVIHTNDSKRPCGARSDRHEHIGKGYIGKKFFQRIMTDERWRGRWMILETPKDEGGHADRRNLSLLKAYREGLPGVDPVRL